MALVNNDMALVYCTIFTSAKTGEYIEQEFKLLCDSIYEHSLCSVVKYVGWEDDGVSQQNNSGNQYISMYSLREKGSFRLLKNNHGHKDGLHYTGSDKLKGKKCHC